MRRVWMAGVLPWRCAASTITAAGSMLQARTNFAISAMLDGTVLATGGLDASGKTLASTEIISPDGGESKA